MQQKQEKGELINNNLLKARMIERGVTEAELAKALNINLATFYRKEMAKVTFIVKNFLMMNCSNDTIGKV